MEYNNTGPHQELDEAQQRLNDLKLQLNTDITVAYSPAFIDAGAVLYQADPQQYHGLYGRLKDKGVRVTDWKRLVSARVRERQQETDTAAQATVSLIAPARPAPWPQPVNLGLLLKDLSEFLRRFIQLDEHAQIAVVLWIVFTYVLDAAQFSPRLAIISPLMRCGKTTLIELLGLLCPQAISTSNITPAAVVRLIDQAAATLLIDEADTFTKENPKLKGIINSGHNRATAFVTVLVQSRATGWMTHRLSTWAAIAYGSIGRLTNTWMDRSIVIQLRRMLANEQVENLADAPAIEAQELTSKLSRFADDHLNTLHTARPAQLNGIDHRAQNNWSLLFAIADIAGGAWLVKAHMAALILSGGLQDDDDDFPKIRLLSDIKDVFSNGLQAFGSTALCDHLNALEDGPWATINRGGKLKPAKLALALRDFEIYPRQRGSGSYYAASDFADAFLRYVPTPPLESATVPQTPGGVGESAVAEVP